MIKSVLQQPKGFYRNISALMLPMVLQNVITNSITLSDAFMVGVLGEQYLAAVTIATTPLFVLQIFIFGVQSGAGLLVSQYWGKGDKSAINRVIGVGSYCSFIVTFACAVLLLFFTIPILSLVTKESALVEISAPYARVSGFAMALNSVSLTYIACQRSMLNARFGFIVLSVSAVLSIMGKWLFIFGNLGMPALGIMGAALSTLFARCVEIAIIAIHAFRNPILPIKVKLFLRPGIMILKDFAKYSLPVIYNESLWGIGMMLFPMILGHMAGAEQILAAYNIAGNLERLATVAVMACANATAVIVGREIGAGRQDRIESVTSSLMALGTIIGLCSGGLLVIVRFTVLETLIFPLFNLTQEAASNATVLLMILVFIIPLRTMCWTMGIGILRSGGDVKSYMYIDVGVLYFIALPMASISGLVLGLGVAVVYSSVLVEYALKLPLIYHRIRSKKWIHNVTREKLD